MTVFKNIPSRVLSYMAATKRRLKSRGFLLGLIAPTIVGSGVLSGGRGVENHHGYGKFRPKLHVSVTSLG